MGHVQKTCPEVFKGRWPLATGSVIVKYMTLLLHLREMYRYTVEPVLKDYLNDHKLWSLKTGGPWWR